MLGWFPIDIILPGCIITDLQTGSGCRTGRTTWSGVAGWMWTAGAPFCRSSTKSCWPVSRRLSKNNGKARLPRVSKSTTSCLAWSRLVPEHCKRNEPCYQCWHKVAEKGKHPSARSTGHSLTLISSIISWLKTLFSSRASYRSEGFSLSTSATLLRRRLCLWLPSIENK